MKKAYIEKQAIIDEIKDKFERAESAVVIDYMGITVAQADAMRKKLREANVDYTVYKNTLVKRAIDGTDYAPMAEVLEGPSALAFSYDDATAPARVLANFAKKHEALVLKQGIVEGKVVSVDTIKELSALPNRDGMLSMLLSCLQSPVSSFARAVKAVADAKEAGSEPTAPAAE